MVKCQLLKYINEINAKKLAKGGSNSKGKGKVQTFINGLSEDELEQVKLDVNDLSVRKFKEKYDMAKKNVVNALA